MLSTIYAAEVQFRHESETRMREHALLASIRERRAAENLQATASVASTRVAVSAPAMRPALRATRKAWARPIGIKTSATAVCAAA
jgi:hypothetical protein